ncbi:hypothetical protein [Actinomyces wuliandei]|uniref:hypothetical protein n=1 Tax=Actinomyces wuliandei TaxID=2057743 RepID=UPI000FD7D759|nr:hypothetical protein [Actinomyces wuliandei]
MAVIVCVLIGAVAVGVAATATDLGRTLVCQVGSAISQLAGGEPLSCGSGTGEDTSVQTQEDSKAPTSCTVGSQTESGGAYVKIAFVKLGGSTALVTQEERYIDPDTGEVRSRYSVVATDTASLGVEVGAGAEAKAGESGLGANLSAEAGVDISVGDTWEFDTQEDAQAFIENLEKYRVQRDMALYDTTGATLAYQSMNPDKVASPPPDPDKTRRSVEVGMGVKAKAKANPGDGGGPGAGAYVEASLAGSVVREDDHREGHEGESTETVTYSGSIGGGAELGFEGVSGTGSYEGAMSTSYDGEGRLTEISFTQTTSGDTGLSASAESDAGDRGSVSGEAGGSAGRQEVTTTTVEVTDSNRAVVEEWLAQAYVTDPQTGSTTLRVPANVVSPDSPAPDDEMQQLLYEEATSDTAVYDTNGTELSLGGTLSAGLKLGAGVSSGTEETELVSHTYLDNSGSPGGTRPRRDSDLCLE